MMMESASWSAAMSQEAFDNVRPIARRRPARTHFAGVGCALLVLFLATAILRAQSSALDELRGKAERGDAEDGDSRERDRAAVMEDQG